MSNEPPKRMKTRRQTARRTPERSSSSVPRLVPLPGWRLIKDGTVARVRGKAAAAAHRRKPTRVSEPEPPKTRQQEVSTRKRKSREEDGEGQWMLNIKKKRGLRDNDILGDPLEGCSATAVEMRRRGGGKRKAAADNNEPMKKKRKKSQKETAVVDHRAEFHAKYEQQKKLGQGGCGAVFTGYRRADGLAVAIKHIGKDRVLCKHVDNKGKQLSAEVAVMSNLAAGTSGASGSAVSLLDWYDLDQELILVLERPVPSKDLSQYLEGRGGSLSEDHAKVILRQLVDAAAELQEKNIFHRDIKLENILIQTASDVPRVRLIDFGLSCFVKKGSFYRTFYGTRAHIPPEWYSNCTYRAGPTTVWQMGVVLFETLHRKADFETTLFLQHKLKISSRLSEDCQDFLRTCLSKDPERRLTLQQLQHHPWLR